LLYGLFLLIKSLIYSTAFSKLLNRFVCKLFANFNTQEVIINPFMATLKLALDMRRVKKDGTYP
jgi:hypothetical protein